MKSTEPRDSNLESPHASDRKSYKLRSLGIASMVIGGAIAITGLMTNFAQAQSTKPKPFAAGACPSATNAVMMPDQGMSNHMMMMTGGHAEGTSGPPPRLAAPAHFLARPSSPATCTGWRPFLRRTTIPTSKCCSPAPRSRRWHCSPARSARRPSCSPGGRLATVRPSNATAGVATPSRCTSSSSSM